MSTLTGEPPADPSRPTERLPHNELSRTGWWPLLRPLLLRLHFYAGILIGPFVLLAAVTGLLYTAAPQIEQIAYRDQLHVTPSGQPTLLSEQVAAARLAHPGGDILEVDAPETSDRTTRVVFTDPRVPADYAMSVFVDPYNAQVVGEVRSFGQWLGFRAWLDEFHRNLRLGAFGRNYSELAASWTWVVILAGLALWITRRRRDTRRRRLIVPDLSAGGRARNLSWHGVLGVWLALGLLGLSVTGLTWSRYAGASIGEVRTALAWQSPAPTTELGGAASSANPDQSGPDHHGSRQASSKQDHTISEGVGIDGVLKTARNAGLGNPLVLTPPAAESSAWTAGENKRSWPTDYDTISVDPNNGQVVDRVDFDSWPFMAKVTDWVIGAHMGILLGVPNQLMLAMLAVALIMSVVRGYRMWWLRRPTRARGLRFGPGVRRGTWRSLPRPLLIAGAIGVLVIGWLVPLLGISLVCFLVLDGLVGLRRGKSRPTADSTLPQQRMDEPEAAETQRQAASAVGAGRSNPSQ